MSAGSNEWLWDEPPVKAENQGGNSLCQSRQPRPPSCLEQEGYNFRNATAGILEWWRTRTTPSDQELRNHRHYERPAPEECQCQLWDCETSLPVSIALCDLIACSLCKVGFHVIVPEVA